jgi:hypothetical protein
MICYKDRTWCTFSTCSNFSRDKCFRAFTEEEKERAIKWWGSDEYPIAVFMGKPECFTEDSQSG